jgi:hypothetical protein
MSKDTMNKKVLRDYLRIMVQHIVAANEIGVGKHLKERLFPGDDSTIRIDLEGVASVRLKPDANLQVGPSFGLKDEGCVAFEDFISEAQKDPTIGQKVGTKSIENSVAALLRRLRANDPASDEDVDKTIRETLKSLRAQVRQYTTIAPVDNLVFENLSELAVGKVKFRLFSTVQQKGLENLTNITNTAPMSEEQKKEQIKLLKETYETVFTPTRVCAEVTIEAESSRLHDLASSEIDASLNLLRCYSNVFFDQAFRVRIGLRGDVLPLSWRPTLGFAESDTSYSFDFHSKGSLKSYVISPETVEALKSDLAFDILSGTLMKPESSRTQMEETVITAIRWLGRGVVANDYPEKILNYAAALERLLIGDNKSEVEISGKWSRRLAFLLGESDFAYRAEVYQRAKELYNTRSRVIHAGRTDVTASDVIDMESYALQSLLAIAHRLSEWREHKQIADWEEAQIFRTG